MNGKKRMFTLKSVLLTIAGTMLNAAAVSMILSPNKVVGGGVSGISTILYHTFSIPMGASFAVINAVLLIIGLRILGREFTLKTCFGAGLQSLFVQIFSLFPPITENTMLAALFGGVIYGLGIGIAFIGGASTGGTDILGRLLQSSLPQIPIGKLLMVVDGIIILVSRLVFDNSELMLLGILTLFISTYTIDWLIARMNVSKLAFVITGNGEEISEYLISTSPRGVTLFHGIGAYSGQEKDMLMCALKDSEVEEFRNKIEQMDNDAFTIFTESQTIFGNGFNVYK